MTNNSLFLRSFCSALLLGTTAVQGSLVTLTFDATGNGSTEFSMTEGGVTATFSNPSPYPFANQSAGLGFANSFPTPDSFDVVFDQPVDLVSYVVGGQSAEPGESMYFSIAGTSIISTGNLMAPIVAGPSNFFVGQPIYLEANESYSFTANITGTLGASFQSWTFDNAPARTPTPAPIALMIAGLGIAVWLRRARR